MLFSPQLSVVSLGMKVCPQSECIRLCDSWIMVPHQQENLTAHQLASLLKCNLPGNSSRSRIIWKMLLTKSTMALDPALDILANLVSLISPLRRAQLKFCYFDTSI